MRHLYIEYQQIYWLEYFLVGGHTLQTLVKRFFDEVDYFLPVTRVSYLLN